MKKEADPISSAPIFPLKRNLDPLLSSELRFYILTALALYKTVDFSFLKEQLEVTDGNLSANLSKLEDVGYLSSHKEFIGKKPRTSYTITPLGLERLSQHVDAVAEVKRTVLKGGS